MKRILLFIVLIAFMVSPVYAGMTPSNTNLPSLYVSSEAGIVQQTITYGETTTTIDWTDGNFATLTFGAGNIGTLAFTNPTNPCWLTLKIIQDDVGSRVVTAYDGDVLWPGGTAPTLSTGADAIDILTFYWDGTKYNNGGIALDLQ
jgi:hypothetical protein